MASFSTREKHTVLAGSILGIVFLVIQFAFLPLVDKKKELERILSVEKQSLEQVRELEAQYHSMTRNLDVQQQILKNRPREFTLFSFLDTRAEKSGVKAHIDYMRPVSQDMDDGPYTLSRVKLKLKEVYLNNCVEFIRQIETSGQGVQVTSLSLSLAGREKNLLDVVLETRTLMLKDLD